MADLFVADPTLRGQHHSDLPQFSLTVSAAATGNWHSAVLVREADHRAYYVRSLRVSWPFLIARPAPSTRQNTVQFRPDQLSPARTSPSHKLLVNWAWQPDANGTQQLRFYVRHRDPRWLFPRRSFALRVRLKEQAAPQRRYAVTVISNLIDWRLMPEPAFVSNRASPAPRETG